jgi:type IV secretion system protein VirB11
MTMPVTVSGKEVLLDSLKINLGKTIMDALADPDVLEILVNPDKTLWIERFGKPMELAGRMEPDNSRMVIGNVATALHTLATVESPIVEGELPLDGSRFEGLVPPIVGNPSFTIRKRASRVFSLEEYVTAGIMPPLALELIASAITFRENILVVGGTGSGKTTLVNGIIHKLSELCPDDRLVIIEDTSELQCASRNKMFLRTSLHINMIELLRATMRLRPDRILIGEVRGGEALSLLDSWNTGHPGGVATVHANSAINGLTRLERLAARATDAPMQTLIGEAVNISIFIKRTPQGRKITEVIRVIEYDPLKQHYKTEVLYAA